MGSEPGIGRRDWSAAEQGHAAAQYALGLAYWTGRGVSQDGAEGVAWLRRAADQGHAVAQYNLGCAYWSGRGVAQKNRVEADTWFLRAAEQGHAAAQRKLGEAYLIGEGGPFDDAEADTWFRRAAEPGRHSPSTGIVTDSLVAHRRR